MPSNDRNAKPSEIIKGLGVAKGNLEKGYKKMKKIKYDVDKEQLDKVEEVITYIGKKEMDLKLKNLKLNDDTDDEEEAEESIKGDVDEDVLLVQGTINKKTKASFDSYVKSFGEIEQLPVGKELIGLKAKNQKSLDSLLEEWGPVCFAAGKPIQMTRVSMATFRNINKKFMEVSKETSSKKFNILPNLKIIGNNNEK